MSWDDDIVWPESYLPEPAAPTRVTIKLTRSVGFNLPCTREHHPDHPERAVFAHGATLGAIIVDGVAIHTGSYEDHAFRFYDYEVVG